MKAQIEVIELKEEPVFSIPVEVDSIMDEVARITSHLDPERRYKIVVKSDMDPLDPSCICQEIWDRIAQRNQVNHVKLMADLLCEYKYSNSCSGGLK
ncbi:hypothetical protein [uncultured Methanobacterium sp.]|uniref:hypothetical protein n=1 Tax=uncultured Methanobacterium sp. TaxID=176306 RepID=UPI002AA79620|nr:hypothetical protein [uncultured Methanobacterium sp.]